MRVVLKYEVKLELVVAVGLGGGGGGVGHAAFTTYVLRCFTFPQKGYVFIDVSATNAVRSK